MDDENKVNSLSKLYGDSIYILDNIVGNIGANILRKLKESIDNLSDYYHGIDSEKQINKLILLFNEMVDIENDVAQIAIGLLKVSKNYRNVQIKFGFKKDELSVPHYDKKPKYDDLNDKRDRIEISDEVIVSLNNITVLKEMIESYDEELNKYIIRVKENWERGNGRDKLEYLCNKVIKNVYIYKNSLIKETDDVKKAINNYDFVVNN